MKIGKKKRDKKLNNKGMTLVEILVAMIILSLVSVTFLEIFSFSLKLNMQAKVKQHALSFSQTLMEGMKAYGRDTLDEQFDEAIVSDGSFKLLNLSSGGDRSVTKHMSGPVDAPVDTGKRTYELDNVLFNGEAYDATITMEPIDSSKVALVTIEEKNKYNDGFFKQRTNENDLLLADIQADVQAYLTSQGDLYTSDGVDITKVSVTSRDIAVNIAADDRVTVNVTYTYSVTDHPIQDAAGVAILEVDGTDKLISVVGETAEISYPQPANGSTDPNDVLAEKEIYNNMDTKIYGARLENLYLYYYPAYKMDLNGILACATDTITIHNASSWLENVYVLKQRNPALNAGNYLNNGESNYDMDVVVASSTTTLNIYHNLAKELQSTTSDCDYSVAGANDMGEPWKDDAEETHRVFDIKIEVTKHGGSEVLCELEGTTNFKTR